MSNNVAIYHFNYAVKEVKERLKVCNALGLFIDDIADIENAIGKALSKVSNSLDSSSRSEARLPELMTFPTTSISILDLRDIWIRSSIRPYVNNVLSLNL
jgi:hypothetical protein